MLWQENVGFAKLMVLPELLSYSFDGQAVPVPLDSRSLHADAIFILDSYHHIVIYYGEVIINPFTTSLLL